MRSSRMTLIAVVLLAGTAALAGGCAQPANPINADALGPSLFNVLDRHDSYVIHDPGLEDVEKTTFLRSSALIRETVKAATQKAAPKTISSLPSGSPTLSDSSDSVTAQGTRSG